MENTLVKAAPQTAAPAPVQKPSVLGALSQKLNIDPQKLQVVLKRTVFSHCKTDEEFITMCMVANKYDLDPILKEIYAFPNKTGAVVPIVGVDGWIKIMNREPNFDGIEFDEGDDYCKAIIYRKDRSHPTAATEWMDECNRGTDPWKRWPKRMLRHKAMIQAARLAFGFAGIYDEDEAARIVESEARRAIQASEPAKKSLAEVAAKAAGRTVETDKAEVVEPVDDEPAPPADRQPPPDLPYTAEEEENPAAL